MWRTSAGDRKLVGAERRLFVAGAVSLFDSLQVADEAAPVGLAAFDSIEHELRRWCVLDVLDAVTSDQRPPTLCAWREAVIMAVFEEIKVSVESEDDAAPAQADWRRLVEAAWREHLQGIEASGSRVEPEIWAGRDPFFVLEELADQVLWDRDFEEDEMQDLPPEASRKVKEQLAIENDYFTLAPTFPNSAEQKRLLKVFEVLQAE